MAEPMSESGPDGITHYSVGALIEQEGKYLLIRRRVPPPGWAGPAGHIDTGESPEDAVQREIKEEVGLTVTDADLEFEELLDWNSCSRGVGRHYWYVFRCKTEGKPHRNLIETKGMKWCSPEEMRSMDLEDVWAYWFEKLGLL